MLPWIRPTARRSRSSSQKCRRHAEAATAAAAVLITVGLAPVAPATASGFGVIATIGVAAPAGAPAADPLTGRVYIPNGDTLTVVNDATNTVTGTIPLGAGHGGSAVVDPGTDTAFVASTSKSIVSVVNLAAGKVTATVTLSAPSGSIAVDPFTHMVFTAGGTSVSEIDEASDSVIATIPVLLGEGALSGIASDPANGTVYVSECPTYMCEGGGLDAISESTHQVFRYIAIGYYPVGVAVSPAGHDVYVGDPYDQVAVVDEATSTVTARIGVGNGAATVATDPVARTAYSANDEDNTVSVIDGLTHSVIATVPVGAFPYWPAVDPRTHAVYVPGTQNASVSVIGGAQPRTGCGTSPSVCGYPGPGSTGVPPGVTLRQVPAQVSSGPGWHFDQRGFISVTGTGADLADLDIPYPVVITAAHVTLRDDLITRGIPPGPARRGHAGRAAIPPPDPAIGTAVGLRHAANVTVEDTTIDAQDQVTHAMLPGIADVTGDSAGLRVMHDDITGTSAGIHTSAGIIDNNYIHTPLTGMNGPRTNAVEVPGGTSALIIEHNTILDGSSNGNAIALLTGSRPQQDRLIDDNLLAGGSYTIYGGHTTVTPTRNITITGNRFSRIFYPYSGYRAPVTSYSPADPQNAWYANFWDDTLAPAPG